jgi:putative NIF3 family GTP cyclohydrolase 1 type 2
MEALVDAHPYEEPAYDAYPLSSPGGHGLGRLGHLPEPLAAAEFARHCGERLRSTVRLAGDPEKRIHRVGLCGGSGASLIPDALRAGADAYVTGDLKHHQALDAAAAGLVVIDAGHYGTEWPFVPVLGARLSEAGAHLGGDVMVSETRTDPFAVP